MFVDNIGDRPRPGLWFCYLQHVFATRAVDVIVCTFVSVCPHRTWRMFSLQPLDYTSYRSSGSRVSSRASSARASPVVSLHSPDILLLIPGFKSHQASCIWCSVTAMFGLRFTVWHERNLEVCNHCWYKQVFPGGPVQHSHCRMSLCCFIISEPWIGAHSLIVTQGMKVTFMPEM